MREIKFRAWDPESDDNGYMVYSDGRDKKNWPCGYDFWFDNENKLVCRWHEDYDDSFGYTQENSGSLANIMQFTGLLDKNGKEIYEGDIFKTRSGVVAVVEYDEKNSRFLGWTVERERKIVYVGRGPAVEVIGNIHENPELLEQQPCG